MSITLENECMFVICDKCGERRMLDLTPDDFDSDIPAALEEIGWIRHKPEAVSFRSSFSARPGKVWFVQDFCADCQSSEPAPRPKMGSGRVAAQARDAFANDPCDEWPRALVFLLAGLRPQCGHSGVGYPCAYCEAGYAIGSALPSWR